MSNHELRPILVKSDLEQTVKHPPVRIQELGLPKWHEYPLFIARLRNFSICPVPISRSSPTCCMYFSATVRFRREDDYLIEIGATCADIKPRTLAHLTTCSFPRPVAYIKAHILSPRRLNGESYPSIYGIQRPFSNTRLSYNPLK